MYEFHGWAAIRQSPQEEDVDRSWEIHTTLQEHISVLDWTPGALDLRFVNGADHLWLAHFYNHRPAGTWDPVELFQYVARIAPGSYGLLYIWDDEDRDGFQNQFQVYVLARGEVYRRMDPFLSPCIPVLEDEST